MHQGYNEWTSNTSSCVKVVLLQLLQVEGEVEGEVKLGEVK